MLYDDAGLNVLEDLVDLLVACDKVIYPDIVTNGIVNAGVVVFLKLLGISVGEDELDRRTVLDSSEKCVIDVTFHIDSRACELNVTVENDSKERNGCRGTCVTAGVGSRLGDVINVLPSVNVTAGGEHLLILRIKILERLLCKELGVLAVVRFVLVKVGGEVRAESRYRNSDRLVLKVILGQLSVEVVEICGRHSKLKVVDEGLSRSAVFTLTCVTVVNSLYSVLVKDERIKEGVCGAESEIEVGVNSVSVSLCILEQLFKVDLLLNCVIPVEIVGYLLCLKTTLGVTRKDEVDVLNSVFGELSVHLLNIREGCQRNLGGIRNREESLSCYRASEGLDVERNIFLNVLFGKSCENAVTNEVIAVCFSHSHIIGGIGVCKLLFLSYVLVGKHNISDLEVTGIFSCRNDRPGRKTGYRDRIREAVGIGRSGIYFYTDSVVLCGVVVVSDELCHCIAFLDDSEEAGVSCGAVGIGLFINNAVYGVTNYLVVGSAGAEVVVSEVIAVYSSVEVSIRLLLGELVGSEERACSVREEGIACVSACICAHVGEYLDALELEYALIKADTVSRNSYGEAVNAATLICLFDLILNSDIEERFCLIRGNVVKSEVSVIEVLVGIVGAVSLDKLLDSSVLSLCCACEGVDRSMLDHRILLEPVVTDYLSLSLRIIEIVKLEVVLKLHLLKLCASCLDSYVEDLLLEVCLSYSLRNEVSRVNTTDSVVNSYAVLDRLYNKLAGQRAVLGTNAYRVCIAVIGAFLIVVTCVDVVDEDLREELGSRGILKFHRACVDRVGEHKLARCNVFDSNLSAIFINIYTVAVAFYAKIHRCQLFFFRINDDRLALIVFVLTGHIVHSRGVLIGLIGIFSGCCA